MYSRNTWKARDKEIKFIGGPRDGDSIEWTKPSSPRERLEYFYKEKIHEYLLVLTYEDDVEVRYWYAHFGSEPVDKEKPSRPYYQSRKTNE